MIVEINMFFIISVSKIMTSGTEVTNLLLFQHSFFAVSLLFLILDFFFFSLFFPSLLAPSGPFLTASWATLPSSVESVLHDSPEASPIALEEDAHFYRSRAA